MNFCIYWTCSLAARLRVCEVLKVPRYLLITGETYFNTDDEEVIAKLHDLVDRGFIKLRNKDEKTKCPF
jgi:hypothetical protein